MTIPFVGEGWSLIPGPHQFDEPFYSTSIDGIVLYPPGSVARAILSYPGVTLRHRPEPSWWEWEAAWEHGGRHIEIGMTLFDDEEASWGGSPLRTSCTADDVLALWLAVRSSHGAVWLHGPDCRVYTPASFAAEHAA
jgi:hypothetical protein